ncbi:EXS-domain-containing protein [Serendipita vermifera]|nr:EXS-domain-containing protein [Serendipita vermifera]
MDIDTDAPLIPSSHFSTVFPLPYRCLFLVGVGMLGWATNLQGLYFLGIDTGFVLDIRRNSSGTEWDNTSLTGFRSANYAHPSVLYRPIYKLFLLYAIFFSASWLAFHLMASEGLNTKLIPSLSFIVLLIALISPLPLAHKQERFTFLRATMRCLVPSLSQSIAFSDVILADIFTSFAKVFGDFGLATRILLEKGPIWQLPPEIGALQWITPFLMSLPYAIRFRQCVAEHCTTKSSKPLFNALKYATAFPVIFLSAAQRIVPEASSSMKHGEHPLFRIWVLFVLVNSVYSFWWDVVNDWGLSFLRISSSASRKQPSMAAESQHRLLPKSPAADIDVDNGTQYAGLRPQLLFGDPMIYYIAIFVNFILRFTWSLKLSSHLHHAVDLEVGVFLIEALEILRRWIWVFLRVEWEALRLRNQINNREEEYEFLMREGGETDVSDLSM